MGYVLHVVCQVVLPVGDVPNVVWLVVLCVGDVLYVVRKVVLCVADVLHVVWQVVLRSRQRWSLPTSAGFHHYEETHSRPGHYLHCEYSSSQSSSSSA